MNKELMKLCEIVEDENGDLRYDWDFGKGNVLSVCVDKDGKAVHFAALYDGKKAHGTIKNN